MQHEQTPPPQGDYEGWAIVETGPRVLVGHVRMVTMYGERLLRISFPHANDEAKLKVQYIPVRIITLLEEVTPGEAQMYLEQARENARSAAAARSAGPSLVQ